MLLSSKPLLLTSQTLCCSYISSTNKPVIISTGMATLGDIENVLNFYPTNFRANICLLQCTSNYPCSDSSLNLSVLNSLRSAFHTSVGFSDHSSSLEASIVAVALGANVIEKHFTLDTDLPGPDHAASIPPEDFKSYIQSIRKATRMLGSQLNRHNQKNCKWRLSLERRLFYRSRYRLVKFLQICLSHSKGRLHKAFLLHIFPQFLAKSL